MASDEKLSVTVTIKGGTVTKVEAPGGIRVEVIDFDVEGSDQGELTYAPNMPPHFLTVWEF